LKSGILIVSGIETLGAGSPNSLYPFFFSLNSIIIVIPAGPDKRGARPLSKRMQSAAAADDDDLQPIDTSTNILPLQSIEGK
jgi:hypothetical protein